MGGQTKRLPGGRSSALDLRGDLDGFQTAGRELRSQAGWQYVSVCVCVMLVMASINSLS